MSNFTKLFFLFFFFSTKFKDERFSILLNRLSSSIYEYFKIFASHSRYRKQNNRIAMVFMFTFREKKTSSWRSAALLKYLWNLYVFPTDNSKQCKNMLKLFWRKKICIQNFLAKCEIGTCFGSPLVSRFISFYEDLGTFKVLNSIWWYEYIISYAKKWQVILQKCFLHTHL